MPRGNKVPSSSRRGIGIATFFASATLIGCSGCWARRYGRWWVGLQSTTIADRTYNHRRRQRSLGRLTPVDFAGIDDQTEVWWDPDATGPNELGDVGAGMWTYAAGGSRYLPGEWRSGQPELFTDDGAVTMFDALPDGEPFPTYQPIN